MLAAGAKYSIQPAVSILIELLEVGEIVFPLVIIVIAEQAQSRLLI